MSGDHFPLPEGLSQHVEPMYFILVSDLPIVRGMADAADGSVKKWKNGKGVWHPASPKSPIKAFWGWNGPTSAKNASLPGIRVTG